MSKGKGSEFEMIEGEGIVKVGNENQTKTWKNKISNSFKQGQEEHKMEYEKGRAIYKI